jgi:hypothetical protein
VSVITQTDCRLANRLFFLPPFSLLYISHHYREKLPAFTQLAPKEREIVIVFIQDANSFLTGGQNESIDRRAKD